MSSNTPEGPETSLRVASAESSEECVDRQPAHDESVHTDEEKKTSHFPPTAIPQFNTSPRDIVRLYQCQICSKPYNEPVTLPCGKSICRTCLPQTHTRTNITYPGLPDRLQGFRCPFDSCQREHAVGDCGVDVILNKAVQHIRDQLESGQVNAIHLELSTDTSTADRQSIGSSPPEGSLDVKRTPVKLTATWLSATGGDLKYEADISYDDDDDNDENGITFSVEDLQVSEKNALKRVQEATRSEMDCQVCYALYYDPLTTACGHTFCRSCLHRILDHSRYCPICRRKLTINPLLNKSSCPSNDSISKIIETYWSDDLKARGEAIAEEEASRLQDFDIPLFVCTLAFPAMPTFLHIFEPRYRLMLRRALDGDRTFGMVIPKRRGWSNDDAHFYELGTLLRIINVQFYPDGRSLVETVGLSRFRVLRHGWLDGYTVGKTERIDDMSLEEEEAFEAAEATPIPSPSATEAGETPPSRSPVVDNSRNSSPTSTRSRKSSSPNGSQHSVSNDNPTQPIDLDAMSTQALVGYCISFVNRMRSQSAPWLAERLLGIYGECPDDPAVFPWWFASMLPVKDIEKYRLLGTSSVRQRLKICATWIMEWETSRWVNIIDGADQDTP